MFEEVERRLLASGRRALSLDPNLRFLEAAMVRAWGEGENPSLSDTLNEMRKAATLNEMRKFATTAPEV